eukprot:COSAG03_NODE_7477_length_912_cov_1.166052_2_plen_179_part_00
MKVFFSETGVIGGDSVRVQKHFIVFFLKKINNNGLSSQDEPPSACAREQGTEPAGSRGTPARHPKQAIAPAPSGYCCGSRRRAGSARAGRHETETAWLWLARGHTRAHAAAADRPRRRGCQPCQMVLAVCGAQHFEDACGGVHSKLGEDPSFTLSIRLSLQRSDAQLSSRVRTPGDRG